MKKHRTEKGERATGDRFTYFFLHNIISAIFFLITTVCMGVYINKDDLLAFDWVQVIFYVTRKEFWELTLSQVFPVMILTSIIGRICAFYCIKLYYKYRDRKKGVIRATKKWSEMNRGINRIGIRFFITAVITSFIYTCGIVALLSNVMFNETLLLPLLVVYTGLKIGTYFFVRYITGRYL